MRRRARKSSAKWLSILKLSPLSANGVGLSEKEIAVKSTIKPTVLPAAIQMDSSISRDGITYDLNLKPVLILISAGR